MQADGFMCPGMPAPASAADSPPSAAGGHPFESPPAPAGEDRGSVGVTAPAPAVRRFSGPDDSLAASRVDPASSLIVAADCVPPSSEDARRTQVPPLSCRPGRHLAAQPCVITSTSEIWRRSTSRRCIASPHFHCARPLMGHRCASAERSRSCSWIARRSCAGSGGAFELQARFAPPRLPTRLTSRCSENRRHCRAAAAAGTA
jgi:hypothetical protein